MKTMTRRMLRQAARGTLRILPNHNNGTVFRVFDSRLLKDLRRSESLRRLRYGIGNTNVERLAVVFFKALKAGEFQVLVKSPQSFEEKAILSFHPSSAVRCYMVKGKVFRRPIYTTADAERVMDELGVEFIRETGGPLSKKELENVSRLLSDPKLMRVPKPL